MDAAKSMGEEIGSIASLNRDKSEIGLKFTGKDIVLNNGDGFSFVTKDGKVAGFRGDVCKGKPSDAKALRRSSSARRYTGTSTQPLKKK